MTIQSDIKKVVLFVDDDVSLQNMAKLMLPSMGYDCEIAECGEDAMGLLYNNPSRYGLVLLDIMMPGISGIEMLEKSQDLVKRYKIPVILQSGLDDPSYFKEAQKYGSIAFLRKPYSRKTLDGLLKKYYIS